MTSIQTYIKEWQRALQHEIIHLQKYGGGSQWTITNGRLLSSEGSISYYFDTAFPLKIPVGSSIKLEWGGLTCAGRVLSSEGKGVILSLDRSFGELIPEATLLHDPWELLQQLMDRLDENKKSKRKRARIKRLMNPSMEAKHPVEKIKSSVHELILRSKYNPVTFVWGPPGTGKTYTLARTAANKYFQKKRVLILAHSNQAVDVLVSEVTAFVKKKGRFTEGDILRYGSNTGEALSAHEAVTTNGLIEKRDPALSQSKNKLLEERRLLKQDLHSSFSKRDSDDLLDLENKIARLLEKFRQKEVKYLQEAFIIGTTLAKAASDSTIYEKEYDVVILDEASMAYVPQVAFAAGLGRRMIVCGDFKQLPPIASSRDPLAAKWLKEDVFHLSGVVDSLNSGSLHPHLFLLKEQRRMHPDISAFTNRCIYQSLVGDHESVRSNRQEIVQKAPFPGRASVLLDMSFTGLYCLSDRRSNSRYNLWQLFISLQLIHEAYLAGAKSIGYVTPYRAQANLMELLIEELYERERHEIDIIAATVHRFQGSERDVMIFDTVDSEGQSRAGMLLTGKDSERLINVAITRTKGKFLHVSNVDFFQKHVYRGKTLLQLIEHQLKEGQTVAMNEIGTWIKHQQQKLRWIHARKLTPVFHDIESAKRTVTVSFPKDMVLSADWAERLNNRRHRVRLTVLSDCQMSGLHVNEWKNKENISFPFVMIDGEILWLGLPLEGMGKVKPPFVAVRLISERICEYLADQFL
jgi:adenylate kinase family enzyme